MLTDMYLNLISYYYSLYCCVYMCCDYEHKYFCVNVYA